MPTIVEVVEIDDHGSIQLPQAVLDTVKPHTRLVVELQSEGVMLYPEDRLPARLISNPVERAKAFRRWVAIERPVSVPLTDEMLRRDNMYD